MKTVAMITMKKSFLLLIAGCTLSAATYAQEAVKDTVQVNKEKSNETNSRNVMLNASSANGPREISIGLPGGDVNVLENGLPVVYNSNPHNVNTHWRGDGSLEHVGLLKISETAITTGTVGYAVNSHTQLGTQKFRGKLNYNTNHFGKQQIDLNIRISTRELSSCVLLPIRTVPRFIKQPSPNAIIRTAVNYRLFIITAIAAGPRMPRPMPLLCMWVTEV